MNIIIIIIIIIIHHNYHHTTTTTITIITSPSIIIIIITKGGVPKGPIQLRNKRVLSLLLYSPISVNKGLYVYVVVIEGVAYQGEM